MSKCGIKRKINEFLQNKGLIVVDLACWRAAKSMARPTIDNWQTLKAGDNFYCKFGETIICSDKSGSRVITFEQFLWNLNKHIENNDYLEWRYANGKTCS